MQRFAFRLERVLQWQIKVCHLAEEELRLARLAVSETDAAVMRLKSDCLAIEHDLLNRNLIASPDLKSLARHRVKAAQDERSLQLRKQTQLQVVEDRRTRLSSERNRLRLIEKLRERAAREHSIAVERELEALALESHLSRRVTAAHL